ncbi:hypothetical protein BJ993_002926 [Nocardioides aromaticivorans]|uniref:Uncharacterized protein n=1 Tax=Nocardioides aromaticivorans TaxID=200618 RepID=A0A7Y9ZJ82_9ACTN|nr:hypothetical protein [Nocardioides aromaticivorans]NYI45846.1 hypothetical protein [Nocardioides aromaticivorans]
MERAGLSRVGRLSLLAAVAATIAGVAAVTAVVAAQDDADPSSPRANVLSDHVPVVDHTGTVTYRGHVVPGAERTVVSVGTSTGGLVLTIAPEDDDLRAVAIHDGSDELAAYDDVRGIALSDPGGTLAAWVEVEESGTGSTDTVIAVDTSTGEELGRLPVSGYANVTAVRGDEVAITDGGSSRLWTPGGSARRVRFVPEDHLVVGFTDTRVIAADSDLETTVYDRSTGAEIATIADLTQWDTNVAGDLLVGAAGEGDVRQVELATGTSRLVDTTVEAGVATFGEDDAVVVLGIDAFEGDDAGGITVDICPQGGECRSVTSPSVPLIPNDAVGQLVSQSA